jgi:hypothetical protein
MTSERGFLSSAMVKIEREENALENWIWESWVRYFFAALEFSGSGGARRYRDLIKNAEFTKQNH